MSIRQQVESLRTQLIQEHDQAPGLFREMAAVESLLAETYRARVLYELLQNSDDAKSRTARVDLSVPGRLVWENDGREFNVADVEALCRSAASTKQRGDGIGYRGIGFKSVAAIATTAAVTSAGVRIGFDRAATAKKLGTSPEQTPLLRVPATVTDAPTTTGARFDLDLLDTASEQLAFDPIALLFLNHVNVVELTTASGLERITCTREGATVRLTTNGRDAMFHRETSGTVTVLVPLNAHAEALTGRAGRFCCFLPLEDILGVPVVVSGDVLTDPSRTHAVLTDPSTGKVLDTAGRLLATVLTAVGNPANETLWRLLVEGEDLRSHALAPQSLPGRLLTTTKTAASGKWEFSYSEVPLDAADVSKVFQTGAPTALYTEANSSAARALRTVFGLPTLRTGELTMKAEQNPLSEPTRARLASRIVETARVEGRPLTTVEQGIVGKSQPLEPTQTPAINKAPRDGGRQEAFGGAVARWRMAEEAAREHLNSRGWSLEDVSRQNLGYDLTGSDPDGGVVHVEVKKVDRKDARFALTNNETSTMVTGTGRYLIGLVIGDGANAQFALLDPLKDQVPRERVCRRWEWEYTDWSRFAEVIH